MTDSSIAASPHRIKYTVHSVIVHPDWDPLDFEDIVGGDVALLYVDQRIPYSDYVQPACLAGSRDQMMDTLECYVTGWGVLRGTSGECQRTRHDQPMMFIVGPASQTVGQQ